MGQDNNSEESAPGGAANEANIEEQKLYLAELDVLKLSQVPVEHIVRKNVQFTFRGGEEMVSVRTIIMSDQGIFKFNYVAL